MSRRRSNPLNQLLAAGRSSAGRPSTCSLSSVPRLRRQYSPGASTEAPLEMLAACHGRVHKQCETLGRLAAHLPTHGSDTAAQQAATAVMRYFDTAARDHHADEEEDLFPALLEAMAGSDAVCLRALTDGLVAIALFTLLIVIEPVGTLITIITFGVGAFAFQKLTRKRIDKWGDEKNTHDGMILQHLQQGLGGAGSCQLSIRCPG